MAFRTDTPQELKASNTCLDLQDAAVTSFTKIVSSQTLTYHADSDCDGVDGVKAHSLFVRCSSITDADGSLAKPFTNIKTAIVCIINPSAIGCGGSSGYVSAVKGAITTYNNAHDPDIKINVLVSSTDNAGVACTYTDSLDVSDLSVNLFGAYRKDFLVRLPGDSNKTKIASSIVGPALQGAGASTDVLLDGFEFVAINGTQDKPTSIGILIASPRAFALKNSVVTAGAGFTQTGTPNSAPPGRDGCNGGGSFCQVAWDDGSNTTSAAGGTNTSSGGCRGNHAGYCKGITPGIAMCISAHLPTFIS